MGLNDFSYFLGYDEMDDVNFILRQVDNEFVKIVLSFNWSKMRETIEVSYFALNQYLPYEVSNYDFEDVPDKFVDDIKNLCDAYLVQWGSSKHYRQELMSLRMVDFVSTRVEGLPFGSFITQYNKKLSEKSKDLYKKPIIYGKNQKDKNLYKVKVYGEVNNQSLGLIFSLYNDIPSIEIEEYYNFVLKDRHFLTLEEANNLYGDLLNRAIEEYESNFGVLS